MNIDFMGFWVLGMPSRGNRPGFSGTGVRPSPASPGCCALESAGSKQQTAAAKGHVELNSIVVVL